MHVRLLKAQISQNLMFYYNSRQLKYYEIFHAMLLCLREVWLQLLTTIY